MKTRRAWQSWLVQALTALCLSSQLAGALHFALVRHTRCAAHGELIHAGAHGDPGLVAPRRASSGRCYEADADASGEHAQHEHCLSSADRRVHTAPPHAGILQAAESTRERAPGFEDARDPLARERWLLAPKSSPPV